MKAFDDLAMFFATHQPFEKIIQEIGYTQVSLGDWALTNHVAVTWHEGHAPLPTLFFLNLTAKQIPAPTYGVIESTNHLIAGRSHLSIGCIHMTTVGARTCSKHTFAEEAKLMAWKQIAPFRLKKSQ